MVCSLFFYPRIFLSHWQPVTICSCKNGSDQWQFSVNLANLSSLVLLLLARGQIPTTAMKMRRQYLHYESGFLNIERVPPTNMRLDFSHRFCFMLWGEQDVLARRKLLFCGGFHQTGCMLKLEVGGWSTTKIFEDINKNRLFLCWIIFCIENVFIIILLTMLVFFISIWRDCKSKDK